MRGLLIVILIIGLGYVFLRQKQNEKADKPTATQSVPVTAPALTPAPAGQASEYNYMKRSLDRARAVRDQSQARTQADQDPN